MATRGRDQSADPGPEWRAAQAARPAAILAESDKSREREVQRPRIKERFLPYEAGAVLVRQLRGPHLSTWP
jgi:hypothetical protein